MDHTYPVEVVDDTGKPVSGAKVALIADSTLGAELFPYAGVAATHADKGSGKYEPSSPITPTAGKWRLVVSLKGKSTVVQPLKLTDLKKDGFSTAARSGEVATVVTTTTVRTVGASKVRETAFRVTLHPAAELVFLGGVDYHKSDINKGWLFHLYGFYRAEVLLREKKLLPGTIITVFSPAKITRTTRVRGKKGWVDVEIHQYADPATRTPAHPYQPVVGLDMHPQVFYKHLSDAGIREPGSVKEAGIFSHSYPGGPILYNTGETDVYAASADRDPNDFDARGKDWNATNLALYPDIKKAFPADGKFVVWGCSATTLYRNRSIAALKAAKAGKGENDRLEVHASYYDSDWKVLQSTVEEGVTELEHRWQMDARFRAGTYCALAAKTLGIEVRSACPGVGSDPKNVEGIEMLTVDLGVQKSVYDYFRSKFAPEFAETTGKWGAGYVDYHALQSRPAIAKPPFSPGYYSFSVQLVDTRWASIGWKITFGNGKTAEQPGAANAKVTFKAAELLSPPQKGVLYVVTPKKPSPSRAFFVRDDGKVHEMVEDATKAWTVDFGEI